MSKQPHNPEFKFEDVLPGRGIVMYKFRTGDSLANGHVDLWDGKDCVYSCPDRDKKTSAGVLFWKLP